MSSGVHCLPSAATEGPLGQIDDEIARLLAGVGSPLDLTDPAAARIISRERARRRNTPRLYLKELEVSDHLIPGAAGQQIRVRAYVPRERVGSQPALVYFHGGAFMLGDLETDDRDCRLAAIRGRCIVLSVDYRLAPEHPFPSAIDDASRALQWAAEKAAPLGVDGSRLAVGGISAGGCLA